jgi:hypothetical protein
MERAPHFVQTEGRPVFTGQGTGELRCRCGESVLVRGYDPKNFLAVDFRCSVCGAMTTTPGLTALNAAPTAVVQLERTAEAPPADAAIPAGRILAGREELERLIQIYQPKRPASDIVTLSDAWLDDVGADYDRLTGGQLGIHLAAVARAEAAKPRSSLAKHPLAWALHTLRASLCDPAFDCILTDTGAVATTLAAAFRYFLDSWSHHPLFPEMAAAASDTGFSLHGTSLFAVAKFLSDSGNRIAFVPSRDGSGRVREFGIAMGPSDRLTCLVDPIGDYEWPTGRKTWEFEQLRALVLERLLVSKARINQKRPAMIVLSPSPTTERLEQPLVDAIVTVFHSHGRRYRHVSAMSIILPKIAPTAERNTVRFGYSFLPVANPKHVAVTVRVGDGATLTA